MSLRKAIHEGRSRMEMSQIFLRFLLFSILLAIFSGRSVASNRNPSHGALYLPTEWSSMCTFEEDFVEEDYLMESSNDFLQLSCTINSNQVWEFSTFTNWSSALNDINVALKLECNDTGLVYVSWPVTDANLKYFTLSDCNIGEFMDSSMLKLEDGNENKNQLRVFEVVDSRILIEVKVLIDIVKNYANVSQSADCGPQFTERFVWRNTTPDFIGLQEWFLTAQEEDLDLLTKGLDLLDVEQDKPFMCFYPNLKLVDFSLGMQSQFHTHFVSMNGRFPRLEVYNLSYTGQDQIPLRFQNWRSTFRKIHILDLSHNQISDFVLKDAGQVKNLEHGLGTLDLRYNNFTVITKEQINNLRELETVVVDLRENPFVCDCKMVEFLNFVHSKNVFESGYLENYAYFKTLTCSKPMEFAGKVIANTASTEICPSVSNSAFELRTVIIILSVTVIVLFVIIFLLLKYRHEVRILIFTRLNIVVPCGSYEFDASKTYDAFISYSSQDLDWVIKILLPMLENQSKENFKLCLHHKDFVPGKAIAENIVESVENSRHTILVVSNNFLQSEWCLYEFRSAFHQSLIEKRRHLIIILLEDVPLNGLESDLKRCLETFTYIKASDKLFLDRVTYALSNKRKCHRSFHMNVSTPVLNRSSPSSKIKNNKNGVQEKSEEKQSTHVTISEDQCNDNFEKFASVV